MRRASPQTYGFLSAVCGLVIVFLINRQRGRVLDESGLLPAHLTGWFWLAFISAIVTVISAAAMLLRPKTAAGDQDRI